MSPQPPFRPRQAPGQTTGGQFASKAHSEADVELDGTAAAGQPHGPVPGRSADAERPYETLATELDAVVAASSPDALEPFITHPDPDLRAEAAVNPYLSHEQAHRLARDPDVIVRWQVTRTGAAGVAEVTADDDDPLVRLEALYAWDLPPDERDRLLADPEVDQTRRALGSAPV